MKQTKIISSLAFLIPPTDGSTTFLEYSDWIHVAKIIFELRFISLG